MTSSDIRKFRITDVNAIRLIIIYMYHFLIFIGGLNFIQRRRKEPNNTIITILKYYRQHIFQFK